MSETIKDGGPAFPSSATKAVMGPDGQIKPSPFEFGGMSLRDWFAGQALMGIIASPAEIIGHPTTGRAAVAYEYADAMLKEREAKP